MNYHLLQHSIVLNYNNKTVVISEDDNRYEDVIDAIRARDFDSIPAIVEIERGFEGTGLELVDGIIHEGGSPIPPELNERILKHKEKALPYEPLIKFWDNLKQNPSYNARQQLFSFLSHNGHPLTEDGYFIAYRGVTNDFKDVHTGQFDNSVGAVCEMPREQVDDNPNNTCSRGLHVACFDYAKGFGPKMIEVKVHPKDVVAVPTDYNGTKMRVCRFEVVAVSQDMRTESVYNHEETDVECAQEQVEEKMYDDDCCQECGSEIEDNYWDWCPHCGEDLRNQQND